MIRLPARLLELPFCGIKYSSHTFKFISVFTTEKTILMEKSSSRLWSRSLVLCSCPHHTSSLPRSHGRCRSRPHSCHKGGQVCSTHHRHGTDGSRHDVRHDVRYDVP